MTEEPITPAGVLTAFQIDVARAFFALEASRGFLLAGGAALAAQGLSTRPTEDLDLFTSRAAGEVSAAVTALTDASHRRGWTIATIRASAEFARLLITGPDATVLVDLAVDGPPQRPAVMTFVGPSLDPQELAGRKVAALFGRAEARDFVDARTLEARYGRERLLELAAAVDPGFEVSTFADMLDSLQRFSDEEIPVPLAEDVAAVRAFAHDWAAELRSRLREG